MWSPDDISDDEPPYDIREPQRTVLFHIASMLDVNECELEFMQCDRLTREAYYIVLYAAIAREVLELKSTDVSTEELLQVLFGLFHQKMRTDLKQCGRRQPQYALEYWRSAN